MLTTVPPSVPGRSDARYAAWAGQKKSLRASEREWARILFRAWIADIDAADVVVVEEVGLNLDLTPGYARAPRGQRIVASIPHSTPVNTALIGSCRLSGMRPCLLLSGVDSLAFEAYLDYIPGPELLPRQIVLLDNLSVHTSSCVVELVEARGGTVCFLPTYSPDLSPIELAFAKFKELGRRAAARTREALEQAVAEAWAQITAEDLRGFFHHCGYRLVTKTGGLMGVFRAIVQAFVLSMLHAT
jgi:transposase